MMAESLPRRKPGGEEVSIRRFAFVTRAACRGGGSEWTG
jgi:hypothetical protein